MLREQPISKPAITIRIKIFLTRLIKNGKILYGPILNKKPGAFGLPVENYKYLKITT